MISKMAYYVSSWTLGIERCGHRYFVIHLALWVIGHCMIIAAVTILFSGLTAHVNVYTSSKTNARIKLKMHTKQT